MQLYTNPASPFCRKVEVVLLETAQEKDVEKILSVGHPIDAGSMPTGINPIGKIPVLARDDGPAIYDSRVICRFLNDRAAAKLYPESRIWEVLTLEATGDGICDAAVLMVYEIRSRPESARYDPWIEGQWTKIARALHTLEDRWMSTLNGPLTIGQIAVGCALGYLDFRHPGRDWRSDHPALASWFADFAQRPAMKSTNPAEPTLEKTQ